MLPSIIAYYNEKHGKPVSLGKVALFTLVAEELSRYSPRPNPWSWRYIHGIVSGRLRPSKYIREAIKNLHNEIDGQPNYAPAPVCPTHNIVHCFDCTTHTPRARRRTWKQPHEYRDLFDMPPELLKQLLDRRHA